MTCKKKRLKCDEIKPTCAQCQRRNVECEGYKKDFKWRSFEETTKHARIGKLKRTGSDDQTQTNGIHPREEGRSRPAHIVQNAPTPVSPTLQSAFRSAKHAITGPSPPAYTAAAISPPRRFSPSQFEPLPILNPGFSPSDLDLPSPFPVSANRAQRSRDNGSGHSAPASRSPTLSDLLLPGTDMRQPPHPSELRPSMSPRPYQPGLADEGLGMPLGIRIQEEDDFEEEILREPMVDPSDPQWNYRAVSPALSDASSTSSKSTAMLILKAPRLDAASPEMLMLRFDKETCGILSIKNAEFENPWRTLIWPLAKDSHALYHAISSMSALHGATVNPQLRLAGMAHMTKSISKLSSELHNMRLDQALATSLALALGEGWDDKVSTGIQHLRGAKFMLNNALVQRNQKAQLGVLNEEEAKRLKFLVNTYVYLDVIARLSATEEQEHIDLDVVLHAVNEPLGGFLPMEVDPLMGCATTLFPLIGKVAALVQSIRKTNSNSLNIVSEANELRELLIDWQPPIAECVEPPEDKTTQVRHAITTAEAYRRAILLHLHQAVPELDLESSFAQAKSILTLLASTPLSSRTLIIQIFPLLVGSCEMVSNEDRAWVCARWDAMMRRLSIMNVVSCWKIVREVWQRRDLHIYEQAQRLTSKSLGRNVSPGLFIPPSLKRKMAANDAGADDEFLDGCRQDDFVIHDHDERPLKRRLTFDVSTGFAMGGASGSRIPSLTRRHTDMTISNLDPEYTVRGPLHWLGVMADWDWEGESLLERP